MVAFTSSAKSIIIAAAGAAIFSLSSHTLVKRFSVRASLIENGQDDGLEAAAADGAEWAEIDKMAMSSEDFKSLSEYLRSTGQASA